MSVNSSDMMQQLLMQRLASPGGQGPQPQPYGGGVSGPQMQPQMNPMSTASQIAQRLMLMRALQQRPQGAPQPAPVIPQAGAQLGWGNAVSAPQNPGLPQP